ncbi:two-component system response regulator EvgA [Pseudomonas fluorescens]|uniref:response regulator transcription factor n=1 Tax=Pseudomonas fluorescens TaxID=294 RepID=UPI00209F4B31|nr:response regulator transcription factor [Pseudomonas fluorescens]MCP1489903.1 two-component system response regulator EvgA [Pseudomonas fluorescens]
MNSKVLLVDEHPILHLALTLWLQENDFKVVAEARNGVEAMQCIHKYNPHIIILELDIPRLSGFVIIDRIKLLELPIKVIVFSAQDSRFSIINCVQAGAHGFVSKSEELEVLLKALHAVRSDSKFYPDWVQPDRRSATPTDPMELLSWRERQVLRLLTQGLSNKQVAERMQLSSKTISTFKTRLLKKLNVNSLLELIHRTS